MTPATTTKRWVILKQDGLLKSTDDESFDKCESCLSGKMTKKPFPHSNERAKDLLGIIHTDVCGPLRHVSRQGASYFITFTDDYSRYGYVYLLKHKHEVRSMMNLTTLPLSFWDYALESATRILNMVPTKKVDKTPYELWYGKVPNLSYLKVWGCEALVKRDTPDKLEQRSVKCIFIGYPKETMGYYFYFPPENKIVVARYAEFFEKRLISQEISGRAVDLEGNSRKFCELIIPGKYASFKDPFMVLSKHQEAGKRFDEEIKRFGFTQNLDEPCVYQKASGRNVTFLILYVDDIIIMGNHIPSLQSVKDYLGKCFAMKDLGEAAFILGIKIYRDRSKRLIGLCQNAYMDKILKRYKMDNSKRGHIPMQERLDLNKSQGAQTPNEVNRMKNVPYASAVGSIMYRLEILKDMFLVYGGNPSTELRVECYCDAGFETDRDDTKSQTGYVFVLNGGAVDWKSSKQSTTAMSATESEYIAASEAAMEALD
ncbi:retrotransposon protein, putative, ty1-copia subclass [Tanacetum coccineum]